ncbi:hypothetical protein ACUNWD_08910 [Sunxiuqinia sp. A32]|uniref:hypothetical protein n=1 Tax=Sunxiuqinia sp. A32 TaxID=3461496 RepID=UPI00404677F9
MKRIASLINIIVLFSCFPIWADAQEYGAGENEYNKPESELFYDSLKTKAYRHRLTWFIYKNLVVESKDDQTDLNKAYEYLSSLNGKTIAKIEVQALDVFGPTFADTSQVIESKLGQWANSLHTKTNLNIIRKNILLNEGDVFDADKVLDNERIIRSLPYIRDVRFVVTQDYLNPDQVNVLVLSKDVFSFGIAGNFDGIESASLEMYNQNIWGMGHQISAKMVGHVDKEPYVGFEGFYTINNIGGNFVDFSVGYVNTYKREGAGFICEKPFIRSTTRLAGGVSLFRLQRADRLIEDDPVETEFPLDYRYLDLWGGYAFQLNQGDPDKNMQLAFSSRMRQYSFFDRPEPDPQNNQYFANSDFYLASVSLSKRTYIRDYLVYSYGITEDIPRGFLHEWTIGYDDNEFNKRWYSHLFFSSGNFIKYKPCYLYGSVGIGGYIYGRHFEQGLFELNGNYISRLFQVGSQRARQFIRLNYMLGIRRFDLEDLYLRYKIGIRGFESDEAIGKQRLSLNLETVLFQNREILKFNIALFGFADLGIIGSNKELIFKQDYYGGIGAGIRLRNESLVFRTLQLRLAYYPNHPPDVGGFGIIFTERRKGDFYSFQPRKPEPIRFE